MTYLNQFHKEASERKMRKIAEWEQSPMSSTDFANYMKRNVEIASHFAFFCGKETQNREIFANSAFRI